MVELRLPVDEPCVLHICDEGGYEVGKINYSNTVKPEFKKNVKGKEELRLLSNLEKPRKYIHIESVKVYDSFRGLGFFRQAMIELETYCRESKLKAIIAFDSGSSMEFYKSIGYEEVGYLYSTKMYIIKKEINY